MGCRANVQNEKERRWQERGLRLLIAGLILSILLLPGMARAASGAEVADETALLEAIGSGEKNIVFTQDISTTSNITVAVDTVIDVADYAWTVDGGTVVMLGTVEKGPLGSFKAGKGTIRVPAKIALENAKVGEIVRSVTYIDEMTGIIYQSGETVPTVLVDEYSPYISGCVVASDGTVQLSLKANKKASSALRIQRVTTSRGTYRFGNAAGADQRLSLIFSITYQLDGGTVQNGGNPMEYTMSDGAITLINPTREGYRFLGWSGTGLNEPTQLAVIPAQSVGDRSYVANWEEEKMSQGGGFGSGGGGWGSGSRTGSLQMTEDTDEEESTQEQTQSPEGTQQSANPRIAATSSSVQTKFYGSRPTLESALAEELQMQVALPQLLVGAGLLLLALAGGLLLWKRRDK